MDLLFHLPAAAVANSKKTVTSAESSVDAYMPGMDGASIAAPGCEPEGAGLERRVSASAEDVVGAGEQQIPAAAAAAAEAVVPSQVSSLPDFIFDKEVFERNVRQKMNGNSD